jgi:hypothetical protein
MCTRDADCGPGGICYDGYCESEGGGSEDECRADADCWTGERCIRCPWGSSGMPIGVCLPSGARCADFE